MVDVRNINETNVTNLYHSSLQFFLYHYNILIIVIAAVSINSIVILHLFFSVRPIDKNSLMVEALKSDIDAIVVQSDQCILSTSC